jgi:hypothetical protein
LENSSYIQWNLPNWITIVLMASVGACIFSVIVAGIKTQSGN